MSFTLTSEAFNSGEMIPSCYTCDGEDLSPPLEWAGTPPNATVLVLTLEFAIDGPDILREVFTHWILFNLSANVRRLAPGVPSIERLDDGSMQVRNDFGRIGYSGPCPPPGWCQDYRFTLYALERPLNLGPSVSKEQVYDAMVGQILGQAQLLGTYQRNGQ